MNEQETDTLNAINLKTLLTLLGIIGILAGVAGTWFVLGHRVTEIENNRASEKQERKEQREFDMARVALLENALAKPRYTLDDDEKRMAAFRDATFKEFDRRGRWMESHDEFRIDTVKSSAETAAGIRELRAILIDMKSDINAIKAEKPLLD